MLQIRSGRRGVRRPARHIYEEPVFPAPAVAHCEDQQRGQHAMRIASGSRRASLRDDDCGGDLLETRRDEGVYTAVYQEEVEEEDEERGGDGSGYEEVGSHFG